MPLLSKAQLDGYLKRLGITDADAQALEPTLGTLQHIHRAHASSIPFETLSMSYEPAVQQWQGVPKSLDDVYTKLVRNCELRSIDYPTSALANNALCRSFLHQALVPLSCS